MKKYILGHNGRFITIFNVMRIRISIERLSLMQAAHDYYNRKIKDLEMIPFYFEAYRYFYMNDEHKKELMKYKFGNTFSETLNLNKNNIQLYQDTSSRDTCKKIYNDFFNADVLENMIIAN